MNAKTPSTNLQSMSNDDFFALLKTQRGAPSASLPKVGDAYLRLKDNAPCVVARTQPNARTSCFFQVISTGEIFYANFVKPDFVKRAPSSK